METNCSLYLKHLDRRILLHRNKKCGNDSISGSMVNVGLSKSIQKLGKCE